MVTVDKTLEDVAKTFDLFRARVQDYVGTGKTTQEAVAIAANELAKAYGKDPETLITIWERDNNSNGNGQTTQLVQTGAGIPVSEVYSLFDVPEYAVTARLETNLEGLQPGQGVVIPFANEDEAVLAQQCLPRAVHSIGRAWKKAHVPGMIGTYRYRSTIAGSALRVERFG